MIHKNGRKQIVQNVFQLYKQKRATDRVVLIQFT